MIESLMKKLEERPGRIAEAKEKGAKVIGYFCPIPEELIHAGGMIPIRLSLGGDPDAMLAGEPLLKSYSCPFARSCLGFRARGSDPYYNLVDAVCVAYTCDGMRGVQEYLENEFKVPTLPLGIPIVHDRFRLRPHALSYFVKELELLKKRLEKIGGARISEKNLRSSIKLYDLIRQRVIDLYELLKGDSPPIAWEEVFKISQAGLLLDRSEYLLELSRIHEELLGAGGKPIMREGPRLMIYGGMIAAGDDKVLGIIKQAGGNIVIDALCSGYSFWRKDVTVKVDLMGMGLHPLNALAERYLYTIPCPFRTDLPERLNYVLRMAREYRVNGLIYYTLKYCELFRAEMKFFEEVLRQELGIPTLHIETEYSPVDTGAIRTKVEAFLEMIRGT